MQFRVVVETDEGQEVEYFCSHLDMDRHDIVVLDGGKYRFPQARVLRIGLI